jgi:cellulose biosynthesis protein BcsQ
MKIRQVGTKWKERHGEAKSGFFFLANLAKAPNKQNKVFRRDKKCTSSTSVLQLYKETQPLLHKLHSRVHIKHR